jgi:hypothetical protein
MKLVRFLGAVAAIAVLGNGGAAWADDKAQPSAVTPVSARTLELSKRYLQAAGFTVAVDQMLKTITPLFIEAETRRDPEITDTEKAVASNIVQTAIVEALPEYLDMLAPEVAKIFTEAELEGAVAFFESPAGRALISKQAALTPVAEKVMSSLLPQIEESIATRLCEELGCASTPQQTAS